MNELKRVIPQSDIDKLERVRVELHQLLNNFHIETPLYAHLTSVIWEITHKKYPTYNSESE